MSYLIGLGVIGLVGFLIYRGIRKMKAEEREMMEMAEKFYAEPVGGMKPNNRLKEISEELGGHMRGSKSAEEMADVMMDRFYNEDRGSDVDDLIEYIQGKDGVEEIMREERVGKRDLEEAYHSLLRAGAGQWVNGHFVAASALAYPKTLKMVLDKGFQKEPRLLVHSLVRFFKSC